MINKPRTAGKIKADYGIKDYYKFYKEYSKSPVDSKKFHKVISEFNKKIMLSIINDGLEYTPITTQITFCIRKTTKSVEIINNKLINKNPIDWKTTLDLWKENEEAKSRKLLIKHLNNHSSKYIFRIKMIKSGYSYINKKYYRFKPCRMFQRALAKRILDPNQDNFQAYDLY